MFASIGLMMTVAPAIAGEHVFYHENVLGTAFELRVEAVDETAARAAETRALAEIDRLAAILSGYDAKSEFRRWMETSHVPTRVSPELFEILQSCDAWTSRTHGAFDPRVQALTALWTRTSKENRVPTATELADARKLMSEPAWKLDSSARTAERLTACPLSFNSIGKGYIIGKATAAAFDPNQGVRGVLLNIGGDLRLAGTMSKRIGIANPFGDSETTEPVTRIEVKEKSVATSGNYQRGWTIAGQWYSHIFDPRTGQPATRAVSATVIADKAPLANVLATTLCVLPVEEGLALIRSVEGAECLLITADGQTHRSAGFARYERPRVSLVSRVVADDAKDAWNKDYELAINFEISPPEGESRRYRRPYVAVWIEDKDGLAVRTLALYLQTRQPGPRWHPDLKRWYRTDQVRKLVDETDLIATVSRATRPAGKYDVIWDGKDDKGKPVAAGEYTVYIEAAREHGTYQLIRKQVTLADRPFAEELKGNVEIKSASVAFRRKDARK